VRWLDPWHLMLLAIPAAFGLYLAGAGPPITFVLAGLGIIPLAALLGRSTEALAGQLGAGVGGLMNATFGNAAELIIGLVALRRGQLEIVKASLTGSIISNALLVLGLSLLVGGLKHHRQTFSRVTAGMQATLLVIAAIGLSLPSVLFHQLGRQAVTDLSLEVAAILLLTYLLSLVFSLITHRDHEADPVSHVRAVSRNGLSTRGSLAVLVIATVLIALLSEILVGAIERAQATGYLKKLGMSEVFVGVVLVALVGNAAEHATAITMAYRNKLDLTMHIAIGSSLQIALLVTPVLVFASLALAPRPLDLNFTLLEVLALGASVVVVSEVGRDGRTHWMEGVLLLAVYAILALAFYHLPAKPIVTI
jgi:Ca2+:H+ antiporter